MNVEEARWLQFFQDPSQWWDNRVKNWTNYPHFKHVTTGKGLWITSPGCPLWVHHKLSLLKDAGSSENARAEFKQVASVTKGDNLLVVRSCNVTVSNLLASLKQSARSKDLETGRKLHAQASDSGLVSNMYVVTSLINMYAKCGCMSDAKNVFDGSSLHHDVVCWTALVTGYVNNRQSEMALTLFQAMEEAGCVPNPRTVVAALSACATLARKHKEDDPEEGNRWLEKGRSIFSRAVANRACDIFVENTLLDMFAKCGWMAEARRCFDCMTRRDIVTWNVLLQGYADNGEGCTALELFQRLVEGKDGPVPDARTYVAAISACTCLGTKETGEKRRRWSAEGKTIYTRALSSGCSTIFVESTLVDMYCKLGFMLDAREVFDNMSHRNVVTWNSILLGYAEKGQSQVALELLDRMEEDGCEPNARSYAAALLACSTLGKASEPGSRKRWLEKGRELHRQAVEQESVDVFVENSLVDMYVQCGDMYEARKVFNNMHVRNQVSWNILLQGYVENGESELALKMFDEMRREGGCVPDARTYVAAVSACSTLAAVEKEENGVGRCSRWLEKGESIHSQAVSSRCCSIFVESALVDLYAKCGNMEKSRKVFDSMAQRDVVSWTALLQGYVENGESERALDLFDSMQSDSLAPNARTYIVALSACAALAGVEDRRLEKQSRWLDKGKALHLQASKSRCCDMFVENMLVDMYGRCGSVGDARRVFDNMKRRDQVSWNALLQGYVVNGQSKLALDMFGEMERAGVTPGARTYVAVLTACSTLADRERVKGERCQSYVEKGKAIHSRALQEKCCDIYVECTMVDLYAKCGNMELARDVFDRIQHPNIVAWTALILGYVENDENEMALEMISRMDEASVSRNALTYVGALMACANLMALERGKVFHEELRSSGLEKEVVVANCLVDFYGKCGDMAAAKQVFDSITAKTIISWTSLMCGYGVQGDYARVFEVFEKMRERGVAPNEVTFVCLLSACSHAGLIGKGKEYFHLMKTVYGISPTVKHYACMVDLYGRANYLDEALKLMKEMPHEADVVMWTAVLGASHKWNNVEVGRMAYDALVRMNEKDGAAYVLMACIYDSGVGGARRKLFAQTLWTDETGKIHKFESERFSIQT